MKNDITIDWTKYVDHIFIMHHINNEKYINIQKQLEYLDILNSGICDFYYDFNDYSYSNICKNIYNIIKISNLMNFNRIIIIQDDIRCIKDKNKIIEYLDNLPDNFDICLFDYQIVNNYTFNKDRKINNYYFGYDELYSDAFCIISKTGINKSLEHCNETNNEILVDHIFNEILDNKIASNSNLFIQYNYINGESKNFYDINMYKRLNHINIDDFL
jgi:hypothetical protein